MTWIEIVFQSFLLFVGTCSAIKNSYQNVGNSLKSYRQESCTILLNISLIIDVFNAVSGVLAFVSTVLVIFSIV